MAVKRKATKRKITKKTPKRKMAKKVKVMKCPKCGFQSSCPPGYTLEWVFGPNGGQGWMCVGT